jgi:hypothetical protein
LDGVVFYDGSGEEILADGLINNKVIRNSTENWFLQSVELDKDEIIAGIRLHKSRYGTVNCPQFVIKRLPSTFKPIPPK